MQQRRRSDWAVLRARDRTARNAARRQRAGCLFSMSANEGCRHLYSTGRFNCISGDRILRVSVVGEVVHVQFHAKHVTGRDGRL
jgi:hypothetical protein